MKLVEVVVPLPLRTTFTYGVDTARMPLPAVGQRVVVPFGPRKFYTGLVVGYPLTYPAGWELKEVAMVYDEPPVVRHPQLKLWQWIADYYMCAIGDVYKAAVPSGLKVESETFLELNPDVEAQPGTQEEARVITILEHEEHLRVKDLVGRLGEGVKRPVALVNAMIARGQLIVAEKLVERYRTRKVPYVRLCPGAGAQGLAKAFEEVKRAPKQQRLLLALVEMAKKAQGGEVAKAELLARSEAEPAQLAALVKRGAAEIVTREVNRFDAPGDAGAGELPVLSEAQRKARDQVVTSWTDQHKAVTLLHGVTSSGKTEIYMHLIQLALDRGEQALYLVPEIALTVQLTRRLQEVFVKKVVIYHSKFSDNERVDIWKRLLSTHEPLVVIGARSAVFLPFAKLGVVIVDEEHDASYKQQEPAPRYNGRDVAMVLAQMHGARTLLGSATPSVETYYKAQAGKFGLVSLAERYGGATLPKITLVDLKPAWKEKAMTGPFAPYTMAQSRKALAEGGQVIFFQNRRGYAPVARCRACAWTPRCQYCDVALTYHRQANNLQCHYCGSVYPLPAVCPQCGEASIETLGYGTERVADEIAGAFPDYTTLRMDLDTTRNKTGYDNIIDDFSQGKAQILVGTQMVTKGLDFGRVAMVGVVNADALINFPDFRSHSHAFNMIEQVAGRAGRRDTPQEASVVVQTSKPDHPVLVHAAAHDYAGFYTEDIEQRRQYNYPPFCRIIYVYLRHGDRRQADEASRAYAAALRASLGPERVYGPEEPTVGRVQNLYIRKVMLKIENGADIADLKRQLLQTWQQLQQQGTQMKGVTLLYDVDPQ